MPPLYDVKNDPLADHTNLKPRGTKDRPSPESATRPNGITPKLLEAVKRGDHSAFNLLYLKCVDPVVDFLFFLLHSREDAEELCQQIFVKLWEIRTQIDPSANFHGYLYKMVRSAAFKHLAHKKVQDKYVDFKMNSDTDYDNSPDELLIGSEMSLLIRLSLENMPYQRRRVFELSRYDNLTHDQIAEKLNISKNTVRVHLYSALKELKALITVFTLFFMIK